MSGGLRRTVAFLLGDGGRNITGTVVTVVTADAGGTAKQRGRERPVVRDASSFEARAVYYFAEMSPRLVPYVGTAGWRVPKTAADGFATTGTHLDRYAGRFDATEIDSSFYRSHRRSTYERWADSVPEHFRFAVKLPKTVTHEKRLRDCEAELEPFSHESGGLGHKLGVVLVQLPPSLAFDAKAAQTFMAALRGCTSAAIALEPRHRSWFGEGVDTLLAEWRVARVAADPAVVPVAGEPAGWRDLAYYRLHGSPRMYYSTYDAGALAAIGRRLARHGAGGTPAWCIFDNTAAGAAIENALALVSGVSSGNEGIGKSGAK